MPARFGAKRRRVWGIRPPVIEDVGTSPDGKAGGCLVVRGKKLSERSDLGEFEGAEPLQSVEDSGQARQKKAGCRAGPCRGDVTRTHDPLVPNQMR